MKFRAGFVTNSSSSSFICEACGRVESGYDIGYSDVNMCECAYGHVFCDSCLLDDFNVDETNEESGEDFRYGFPVEHCPICNLVLIPEHLVYRYVQAISLISVTDVLLAIKREHPNRTNVYDNEYLDIALRSIDKTRDEVYHDIKKFGSYKELNDFIHNKEKRQ